NDVNPNDEPEIQAFLFDASKFAGEEAIRLWLTDHNYPEAELHLSGSTEEPHIAICFDADLCEPGTGRRDELEDGVTAVTCMKEGSQTTDTSESDKPNPHGDTKPQTGPAGDM